MLKVIQIVCIALSYACVGQAVQIPVPAVKDPAALIGNELVRLDQLIWATRQSLEGQIALREKIVEYQKIQNDYFKHPQDNEVLFHLIKNSYLTLQAIKENHLEHAFDSDFINELTVISQSVKKRGIPKP